MPRSRGLSPLTLTPTHVAERNDHLDGDLLGVGLNNEGNTCFMNSLLQCLAHLPGMLSTVKAWSRPLQLSSLSGEALAVAVKEASTIWRSLEMLFHDLCHSTYTLSTERFRTEFYRHSFLEDGEMHDVAEFFHSLINILQEQEAKRFTIPSSITTTNKNDLMDVSIPILRCSLGHSLIIKRCHRCGQHTKTVEKFHILTLPMPTAAEETTFYERKYDNKLNKTSLSRSFNDDMIRSDTSKKRKSTWISHLATPLKKPRPLTLVSTGLNGGYSTNPGPSSICLPTTPVSLGRPSPLSSTPRPRIVISPCSTTSQSPIDRLSKISSQRVLRVNQWNADKFPKSILGILFHQCFSKDVSAMHLRRASETVQLRHVLRMYSHHQLIEGAVECAHCGDSMRTTHTQRTFIADPPTVLVVQLARFAWNAATHCMTKDTRHVLIDSFLHLSVCQTNGRLRQVPYRLHAVICHLGATPSHGHYKAYVRHEEHRGCQWICYDDELVTQVEWRQVARAEAYLLMYKMLDEDDDEENRAEVEEENMTGCSGGAGEENC